MSAFPNAWVRLFLAAGLFVLTGCGAAAPTNRDVPAEPSDSNQLRELSDGFDQAIPQEDCVQMCLLAPRICDVAWRICAIEEENPGDPELQQLCNDATERCQFASGETEERCLCEQQ
ncbi:MAG: hypothetical protein KC561_04705 [Myxococcales bacterium]|nr:hypothetical protein [Myxococcales bacterium]